MDWHNVVVACKTQSLTLDVKSPEWIPFGAFLIAVVLNDADGVKVLIVMFTKDCRY